MADLNSLGTTQLRRLAAYRDIGSIGGKSLKFARRRELIAALTAWAERQQQDVKA